jgi:hypothetical protein
MEEFLSGRPERKKVDQQIGPYKFRLEQKTVISFSYFNIVKF